MSAVTLSIGQTWDGAPLSPAAVASLSLQRDAGSGDLLLTVVSPDHGDPLPPGPPGPTPGLWAYEVVELFVAGDDGRYLEVELGPRGHHLVLQLHGVRQIVASDLPLDYTAQPGAAGRFVGHARIPAAYLPPGLLRANAYAIHGGGCGRPGARCHHAHTPLPGPQPDFHQPARFVVPVP